MELFLYSLIFSVLTDVVTAGRLLDSVHFTRDRSDDEIEAMLGNPWVPRAHKVGLLQDLVFDLQEYAADPTVDDVVFDRRLEAFELGCFVLDPAEKEVEFSAQDFAALTARRARTVKACKRIERGQLPTFSASQNRGGLR